MARKRKGRPINGIVLLDKGYDISSNKALQHVKHIYFAQKAGHTGALDPLATGMLPICLGEATKFSQFLLDTDKTYQVTAQLGVRTATSDLDGEVISTREVLVSEQDILAAIDTFRGKSEQVPSMYSALKYQGQPLYKYAREGIEVPREARSIEVFRLDVLSIDLQVHQVTMEIHCSKGTYIRTIVDDLGEKLGCGAHVTMLRRIGVGPYPADKMVTLEQLEQTLAQAKEQGISPSELLDPLLLPMQTAVTGLIRVEVTEQQAQSLRFGNPVDVIAKAQGMAQVYLADGHFVGVAEISGDKLAPKRIVVY